MTNKHCGCSTASCGCCEGVQALTPAVTANQAGLDNLTYRVGTHGAFLETMKARLASMTVDNVGADGQSVSTFRPLRGLTTRDSSDPAIALLDGWAMVGDVLTFYQERIANEAYLRTATERRSVLELARLVGYTPRPGVASSVYLAYTVDDNQTTPVEIPAGTRAQSIPGPDEVPQFFETSEALVARAEWSHLLPKQTAPQEIKADDVNNLSSIFFTGTDTGLKPFDPLFFEGFGESTLRYVESVETDFTSKRSRVRLGGSSQHALFSATFFKSSATGTGALANADHDDSALSILHCLTKPLSKLPAPPAARSSLSLTRNLENTLGPESDVHGQLVQTFNPIVKDSLYAAWASGAQVARSATSGVYSLGVKSAPFGSNASLIPIYVNGNIVGFKEWNILGDASVRIHLKQEKNSKDEMEWMVNVTGVWNKKEYASDPQLLDEPDELSLVLVGSKTIIGKAQVLGDLEDGVTLTATFDDSLALTSTFRVATDDQTLTVNHGDLEIIAKPSPDPQEVFGKETQLLGVEYIDDETINIRMKIENSRLMALEAAFDQILPDSKVVIFRSNQPPLITDVVAVSTSVRSDYYITGKSTLLTLAQSWRDAGSETTLAAMRGATVYANTKRLELAEDPVTDDIEGNSLELDRLYDGLKSGRWVIVSGERTDVTLCDDKTKATGVMASELVMIKRVRQSYDATLPGDKIHTILELANALSYSYKRETVTIYGNVIHATHGETRQETLGSGNGAIAQQTFALKQPPLTFISAQSTSGIASTLQVYVNDIEWHEDDTLAMHGPRDRNFVTKTSDDDVTSIIFGDGKQGARLPTGVENVKAVYRSGIGRAGNVKAGQISQLATRPLGVKEVVNPMAAGGGVDKESRDMARANAPLAVMALDRLVSVQDYADFTRTFAGIGKAVASQLSDSQREIVHITIAGVDDVPIDKRLDLYLNLCAALQKFGDPDLPIRVDVRELIVLILSARIQLAPDYLWDPVASQVRARLVDRFGFSKQGLAQPVALGQVLAVIQNTEGVAYVDVDVFTGIPQSSFSGDISSYLTARDNRVDAKPASLPKGGEASPAQLAVFLPSVPDTLILNQIG